MIGREKEIKNLNRLYNKDQAEFVAIYGRRRVGKTFLIDEVFKKRFSFRHLGLSPVEDNSSDFLNHQLEHFYNSLLDQGMKNKEKPKTWFDAFLLLQKFLEKKDNGSRQVVFLDELPWLDTPRSNFMTAFEGFWNNWGCHRKNLMLIVCGSANSWIQNKLINNHGGLYNRITYEIKLSPFNLKECEEYYKQNNINISRYDIVQGYMAFGGIPYYLGYIDSELSMTQNIDNLFFKKDAILIREYDRLFNSIFVNPEPIKKIVNLLSTRSLGYTKKEIVENLKLSDGGGLTRNLNALVSSDFVLKYVPFGTERKVDYYKLVDPFCIFYLHFISKQKKENPIFWQQNLNSPIVSSWRGFAFENVCFNHIEQIKKKLGINGVISNSSSWSKKDNDEGTQIDLLIYRNDNVINMCEMKFYSQDFLVDKEYYKKLLKRQATLQKMINKKTAIYNTLITTFGLEKNEYSSIFQSVILLDDLFK